MVGLLGTALTTGPGLAADSQSGPDLALSQGRVGAADAKMACCGCSGKRCPLDLSEGQMADVALLGVGSEGSA